MSVDSVVPVTPSPSSLLSQLGSVASAMFMWELPKTALCFPECSNGIVSFAMHKYVGTSNNDLQEVRW